MKGRKTIFLFLSFSIMTSINFNSKAEDFYMSPFFEEQAVNTVEIKENKKISYSIKNYNDEQSQYKKHKKSKIKEKEEIIETKKQENYDYDREYFRNYYEDDVEIVDNPYLDLGNSKEELSQTEQINLAINKAAIKTGLPENLIRALIKKESSFNPLAVSRTGAMGLTQLMPSTALGECNLQKDELFNIEKNIACGSFYLKKQIDYFKRFDLALAAYNAGPGAVRHAMKQANSTDIDDITALLKSETAPYVKKILADMNVKS